MKILYVPEYVHDCALWPNSELEFRYIWSTLEDSHIRVYTRTLEHTDDLTKNEQKWLQALQRWLTDLD